MLYQTLVGAWPPDLRADDREGLEALAERIERWQLKAIREAKRDSRWTAPDEAYEAGCTAFSREILTGRGAGIRRLVAGFVDRIGAAGALNGLSQALLRMTAPGVPDLYQGTEFWDFSLVDPDNRRPVDFSARMAALGEDADPAVLLESWHDGRVKQAIVTRTLRFRQAHPALFSEGGYEPLVVEGALADKLIAFSRRHGSEIAVTLASRHAARLTEGGVPLIPAWAWDDTEIVVPEIVVPDAPEALTDVLTGRTVAVEDGRIRAAEALAALPVALLTAD
jgi:(1->4)-alpha-D-glucan 1-alpha-D-glucosylmutase